MKSSHCSQSDVLPTNRDPNPILDPACPKSAGGIGSAAALCLAMDIDFKLEPLDCKPFYHGYGMKCSERELVIGIWKLPLVDLNGNDLEIPFYVTKGNGFLLIGNSILSLGDILNTGNLLVFKCGSLNGNAIDISLPIFTTSDSETRTHLHVLPTQISEFQTYFFSSRSSTKRMKLRSSGSIKSPEYFGRTAKEFAHKLHLYTHMTFRDMVLVCRKGNILTSKLLQELQKAVSKCTSCKTTGKPLHVRKVSLSRFLKTFNESVQIDYMWIKRLTTQPILQIRNRATGFRSAIITPSKDMDVASRLFEYNWINNHGPPVEVSGDPEFHNTSFVPVLEKHGIKYNATPARRHSKTGCVESGNTKLRVITERLLADAEHHKATKGLIFTEHEILSKAVFLTNVLHVQKNCSAFELARGLPALCRLPKMPLGKEITDAHHEQVVRRALAKLLRTKLRREITHSLLSKGQQVYFFEKIGKQGIWRTGYVQDPRFHYVVVTRTKQARGKPLKIAYEDLRTIPETSLLREIDILDLEVAEDEGNRAVENACSLEENNAFSSEKADSGIDNVPKIIESNAAQETSTREANLWAMHPRSPVFFTAQVSNQRRCKKIGPMLDIGKPSSLSKDIGDTPLTSPPLVPYELESAEQVILSQIRQSIGDDSVSESRLQFAPRWVIDKAIQKEKENFAEKKAYEEVNIRDLPPNSNLISSHHFFQIKMDGSENRLKLKFRLVPHGNKDKDKDDIRKDSTTAQFPVIRDLLSAAAILDFNLGTIDISGAYLQARTLNRDVFVRLPRGWTDSPFIVWKLLFPAYGLVESGRLWQLTVEYWMEEVYGTETVMGFVQLLVVRRDSRIVLVIAKVVDDFLIAGKVHDIHNFHNSIVKRF